MLGARLGDITLDLRLLEQIDLKSGDPAQTRSVIEQVLKLVLGNGYAANNSASPLIGRLSRMKRELSTGGDTFGRKLRYFLWLN